MKPRSLTTAGLVRFNTNINCIFLFECLNASSYSLNGLCMPKVPAASSFLLPLILFAVVFFIGFGQVNAATTTIQIYPTDDGRTIMNDSDGMTDWSTARNFTGTINTSPSMGYQYTVQRADKGSGYWRIYRSSTLFDTSVIPDDAEIVSASMNLYKYVDRGDSLVITGHTRASTTDLAKGDWKISSYGDEFARGVLEDNQYTVYDFNATGTDYIDPTGYTVIGGLMENDFDDIDVGSTISDIYFHASEYSGTNTDPYLEITYVVEPKSIKIYPAADADDGRNIMNDSDGMTVWSTARNFTGTLNTSPSMGYEQTVQRADKGSGYWRIYRSSTVFDTSVIPDDSDIEIASASMNAYKAVGNNHGQSLVLTAHTRASTTNLAKGDWKISNYGDEFARGVLQDSQYTMYEFNASGTAYIDPDGYTIIGGLLAHDYDDIDIGSTLTGSSFYSSEATGTSTDPYLEVKYYDYLD